MTKIIRIALTATICLGLVLVISCEEETVYYQLTSDQLRHLYLVDSSYVYSGEPEEFTGTAKFLKNGSDTLTINMSTRLRDLQSGFFLKYRRVDGISELDLNEENFQLTIVEVDGGNNRCSLVIGGIEIKEFKFSSSLPIPSKKNPNTEFKDLDTALVNGTIYHEVYKFTQEDTDKYGFDLEGFDRVYFAKDYGFILIQTLKGLKLELINE